MAGRRLIDIGANLLDPMYVGVYNGRRKHEPDLTEVLARAWTSGVDRIIVTGGSLKESQQVLDLCETSHCGNRLFATVGCHPTRCDDFDKSGSPDQYLADLKELAGRGRVVALGECGLDYDRLHFCTKEVQLKYFEKQLIISKEIQKPLFLHCRNAEEDFLTLLKKHEDRLPGGVVHSFTGPLDYALKYIDLGFYIGINGCSLKSEENLNVVKQLPVDKMMLETDSPWCEVRPSHASAKFVKTTFPSCKKEKWVKGSMVKSRNEPCTIVQVLEIVSSLQKDKTADQICDQIYKNTLKVFFPEEFKKL